LPGLFLCADAQYDGNSTIARYSNPSLGNFNRQSPLDSPATAYGR
jgi:hypothetical protein